MRRLAWSAVLLWSGSALAQLPAPEPLDSLLRSQQLAPARPAARPDMLSSPDILSSPGTLSTPSVLSNPTPLVQGRRPDPTCDRTTMSASQRPGRVSGAPLAYGGSGPGEYGRYVPGLPPDSPAEPSAPPSQFAPARPSSQPGASQPSRYGWGDRPLAGGTTRDERRAGLDGQPTETGAPSFDRPLTGERRVRPEDMVPCDETGRPLPGGTRR